ncbi:MAG: hypothetical protein BTN85_1323 [Candidatus Methanohalarchaeum thermophilum]|uniref:Uncharacterized protein n=1 Tax=Methanohalarchaeum thermophilum TaxID=1903181 RepID=A0A1Q6DWQ4_METT1|nr:MAG: hypothetical protein BTN85_1323 [Candidatus Methanohalarchaeum thermophilum]
MGFLEVTYEEFFKHSLSNVHTGLDEKVRWKKIGRRLRELYGQKLGFIIFQVPTHLAGDFRERLKEETGTKRIQVIEIKPKIAGKKNIN